MIFIKCENCNAELEAAHFWRKRNRKVLNVCKDCCLMYVNVYNPDTFLPILKILDIPYIQKEWIHTLKFAALDKRTSKNEKIKHTVLCKYIAAMKLVSYRNYSFKDTALFNQGDFEDYLKEEVNNNG